MDDGSNAKLLVNALASGQPEAYAALYDRLGQPLLRVAGVMLRSHAEAQDAVQDLFVDLVRNRNRLQLVEDLDAYVFAMLRNVIGRQLRRRETELRHLRQLPELRSTDAVEGLSDELEDALELALGSLPAEQREVISLKIDGGLTFAQVASIMKISPNTAASRYRYAIEKLRVILEAPK